MQKSNSYCLPLLTASDHAGFKLKQQLKLKKKQILWRDLGCFSEQRTDYPDWADKLCKNLQNNMKGLLICGTGQGMAIKANRYPHIRAALCWNPEIARFAINHNQANVLCLPGRFLNIEKALLILDVFLTAEFNKESVYQRRIKKLHQPV